MNRQNYQMFHCNCSASSIADGSVRLADGDTPNEGRVEIYHKYRKSLSLETAVAKHKYLVNTVGNGEQYAMTIGLQLTEEWFVSN